MTSADEWIQFFDSANESFLAEHADLFIHRVSERTLCGCIAQVLLCKLQGTEYNMYYVDVEYNRNKGKLKMILDAAMKVVTISCDVIVHSRGKIRKKDNLIALEMKKSERPADGKRNDKERLIALTKTSYVDIWSADGIAKPEYVCGYSLGIYYEVNIRLKKLLLEYYTEGKLYRTAEKELFKG
jgi:hypothetical protein